MALERELQFFETHKAELLEHSQGQFAVVHDQELVGTFASFQEAFDEGVRRFGLQPFLIKKVVPDEVVEYIPALSLGLLHADME